MLFTMMNRIAELNIPMCLPIEFDKCDEGVYTIQSWINGIDLVSILPLSAKTSLPAQIQYALGRQAGIIAKKIHSIPILKPNEEWSIHFNREIDTIVLKYHECGLHFDGDKTILDYINNNRFLLENRPFSFLVWDYNVLNMMYENDSVQIIDFEYFNIGDPWKEFDCIFWSAMASPYFATGQINGYFDGKPPKAFFKLLAFYSSILLLSLMTSWAIESDVGQGVALKLSQDMLIWYDNMQNDVPTWYLKNLNY